VHLCAPDKCVATLSLVPPRTPTTMRSLLQIPEPHETVESAAVALVPPVFTVPAAPSTSMSAVAVSNVSHAAATTLAAATAFLQSLTAPLLYTLGADGRLIVLDVWRMATVRQGPAAAPACDMWHLLQSPLTSCSLSFSALQVHEDTAPPQMGGVIAAAALAADGGRIALATSMAMTHNPVVVAPGATLSRFVPAALDVPGASERRAKLASPRKKPTDAKAPLATRKAGLLDPAEAKRIAQVCKEATCHHSGL
jgi:hypothetical protein